VIRGEVGDPGRAPVVTVIADVGEGHVLLPLAEPGQGVLVVHLQLGGHLDCDVLVYLSGLASSVPCLTTVI
jgi:hypothetical protein